MKLNAIIQNQRVTNRFDLPDGVYDLDIKPKGESKTWEQTKKLWATIDDISRHEYGDTSQSINIYLQILRLAGIRTDRVIIPEVAVKDLKRKAKALDVISREVINHQPFAVCNVCFTGISEMSKKEVSDVIECAIRYASEIGIETELENDYQR